MPSAQVTSYTVHVGRLGQLGTDRLIAIRHVLMNDGSPVEGTSEIYFGDRFGTWGPGFGTAGRAEAVRAHLPEADYAAWIDLLRHEAPVYVHWSVPAADDEPAGDGIVHLATGPEPPGEGPVDFSH